MTLPVPNLTSALGKVTKDAKGNLFAYLIPPWNSFFQQFVQPAPAVASVGTSPFTANANGTVIFSDGTPVITLIRGTINIVLTGQRIIPISVGDTVTWSGATSVQFLGA